MRTFKKALSVFLCFVMLFTTFCFFPFTGINVEADAATITNEGRRTAFYAPEVIYLYPNVASWKDNTFTPFQYFVENTVDVNNIYNAPVPNTAVSDKGTVYFASEEGMNEVILNPYFMKEDGTYYPAGDGEIKVSAAKAENGYYSFEVTGGTSPSLSATENGCYIIWVLEYTTNAGEHKGAYAITYVYKPYVVPYGAVARVYNTQGDVNVDSENITWVSGVHSIDNSAAAENTLYPRYQTVSESVSGSLAFSPFLSKDRYGYVGSNKFQGDAAKANGTYYAVFSNGNSSQNAYFWAGQTGASILENNRADSWFIKGQTVEGDKAYNIGSFDYMNNENVSLKYATSQITPTKLGTINIDTSRYSNLNEIPNLAVGFMITANSAIKGGNAVAKSEGYWVVGDATGKNHATTGAYTEASDQSYALFSSKTGVDSASEFARENVSAFPINNGIKYAGAWNKELTSELEEKYTVKSIVKIDDTESADSKYIVTSSAVGLNAVQIDKSSLRAAVMRASQHLGALGTKRNGMSLYYAASSVEWNAFADNYIAAYKMLTRLDATAEQVNKAEEDLSAALNTLLNGTALKVLFDVNYGGINPNLLAASEGYEGNGLTVKYNKEIYTVDGSVNTTVQPILTFDASFDEGEYVATIEKTDGKYTIAEGKSALVFEFFNKNKSPYDDYTIPRLKQDIGSSFEKVESKFSLDNYYADNNRSFNFWIWRDNSASENLTFTGLSFRLKVEKAGEATAYSPAAKIIEDTTYGELPEPTRDGYSFGGWYADKACTVPVTADSKITARVLYAKWVPNVYSVVFDSMFSLSEFVKYPTSLTICEENANAATAEYADGKLTVSAKGTANDDVYTLYGCGDDYYNLNLQPSTEYVFEYDVDVETGSQVHVFLYDSDNGNALVYPVKAGYTVYDTEGNLVSETKISEDDYAHCYLQQDGHVVIRFTTPDTADKAAVRFGTTESTNTTTVYSNIRLVDAKTYDLIKWDSAQKLYPYGETYGELATATRDGYVFEGWYTGKNGNGDKITEATSVISSNITLYSNWIPNTYNVTLYPNNADSGKTIRIENCVYDKEFELPDITLPENNYNKTGYTFLGWSTDPDSTVAEFGDMASVKNLTPDVNGEAALYAVWGPNVFNVQFNSNGGQGSMANQKVAYNSNAPLPECAFTRPGYTFLGWSRTTQGSVISEAQYDVLTDRAGATVDLWAIWAENFYTVTFDKNGGEGTSRSNRYSYTTEFTLPGTIFTKPGYILSGWSTSADGEKVYDINQKVSRLSDAQDASVTLYAVWTPITYKVMFNSNGGSGEMDFLNATYGKTITLPAVSFAKPGYHFLGWATTPGGEAKYKDGAEITDSLSTVDGSEVTLWAVWEINTYTVTFKYKNALGEKITSQVSVKHGDSAEIPKDFAEYPVAAGKKHYVFTKWSVSLNNISSDITADAGYGVPADCSLKTTETPATCTKEGSIVTKCSLCAYEHTEVIPKLPHSYGEGVDSEITCLEGGTRTFTCSECNHIKTENIEAPGHSFILVEAKEATCKEPGNIEHKYCDRCKKGYDPATATATTPYENAINYITTKNHTPGAEPTCTAPQICTVCETVLKPALGHSFKVEYLSDTYVDCSTTPGDYKIKKTCTVCGHSEIEEVYDSFLPHDYVKTTVPPTCTEPGYDLYACSRCPEEYRDNEVTPLGHKDEGQEWVKISDPTCTEPGEYVKYCTVCGEVSQPQEIPAKGHTEGEWVVTKEATCTETGVKSLMCSVCNGAIKTETLPLKEHDFQWTVTLQPGCDTMGKETDKCTVCGASRGSRDLPMLGHDTEGEATCEEALVCKRCLEVVEEALGHDWNNGSIIKEPTETEEGLREFICLNDPTHKDYQVIPVRIVIQLPVIPSDGTYDLDANENGYLGNIHTIVTVEDGIEYSVMVDNANILTINDAGYMTAVKDGNAVITIITNDGKYQKQLPVTVRTLKTITFDVNGVKTDIKAYAGDSFTPITVDSFVDENGYEARFKAWLLNGTALKEFICTGEMYLVAQFTSSCDYTKLDELTAVFYDIISGNYNNALLMNVYKQEIETAKAMIDEFSLGRNTRDSEEQGRVDAAAKHLAITVAKIYPEEGAWIEIRGNKECTAGTYADITAYLMPVNVELADGVWVSSDTTTGFFTNDKFYAVKQGTVTLTVSRGSLSASIDIIINSTTGARVIFFDTLLTNANYILESGYVVRETTNLFWAPDAPVHFRVITDGTFEEYNVYVNEKKVTPDIRGTYTIPANTGDAHVRIEGLMSDITDDSDDSTPKMSFWDAIRNFFKRIADFFRNLFSR